MSDVQQPEEEDPIQTAAADIVEKVVGQVGGDLDRVGAIGRAQVIAGRALRRLCIMAQSERVTLDRLTIVGVVADVAKAEESSGGNGGADTT